MKSVIIVGAGALGSHVLMALRNLDVKFTVMDFDRVEQKNTMSQFFGKPQVGKNKAQAVAQLLDFLWQRKVQALPHKLTKDNAEAVLSPHDLVIDCVDNPEARHLMRDFVRAYNQLMSPSVPKTRLLHGALAADGSFGQAVWDEHFVIDEGGAGGATCEDGEHLPFISVVASYVAHAARLARDKQEFASFQVWPTGAQRIA